jgi:MFS family permease
VGAAVRGDERNEPRSGRGVGARTRPAAALSLPVTLLVLGLAYWCVDTTSPALPVIRDSLALSATGAGLIASLFFFGRLVTNLPAAMLIDRHGPRLTAAVGASLLGVGSAVAAIAPGESVLLPARAIQGAGVAFLATAGLLSVLRAMPRGGAAMTAFNVTAGLGGNFGIIAGSALTAMLGWRAVFWQCVALAAVILVAVAIVRPAVGRKRIPGVEEAADDHPVAAPLASPGVVAALLANLLVYVNYAVWVVSLPLFAAVRFDAGPGDIGRLLLVINTIHLVGAIPAGGLIRRWGGVPSLAVGFSLVAVGLVTMILAPSPAWLLVPMAFYALGEVAGNSAAGDLLLRLGGGGGRAVGMVRLTSDIGMVVGPAAAGVLADAAGVTAPIVVRPAR